MKKVVALLLVGLCFVSGCARSGVLEPYEIDVKKAEGDSVFYAARDTMVWFTYADPSDENDSWILGDNSSPIDFTALELPGGKVRRMGSWPDFVGSMVTTARIDDSLYRYYILRHEDGELSMALGRLSLSDGTAEVKRVIDSENKVCDAKAHKNYVMGVVHRTEGDLGSHTVELYDPTTEQTISLVQKTYSEAGNAPKDRVEDYASDGEAIYVLCSSDGKQNYYIEKLDEKGTRLAEIPVEGWMNRRLRDDTLSDFTVCGDYVIYSVWSDESIFIGDISSGAYQMVFAFQAMQEEESLSLATVWGGKQPGYLLFKWEQNELYLFRPEDGTITRAKFPFTSETMVIYNIATTDEDVFIIAGDTSGPEEEVRVFHCTFNDIESMLVGEPVQLSPENEVTLSMLDAA